MQNTRGFFGIGMEEVSKSFNAGNVIRTAHAFGASFFFTINSEVNMRELKVSDTSSSWEHMPHYEFESVDAMQLPKKCGLVGIELTDRSIELPSFRHPLQAAYVLGPEMGHLSPEMQEKCDHIVQIPMSFCVNVGIAGAIVMYDRMISLGKWAERPVKPGAPLKIPPRMNYGGNRRKIRTKE